MAHTCNQYLDNCLHALDKSHEQTKKYISDITSSIATLNSQLTQLDTLSGTIDRLTVVITKSHNPISYKQPSHQEGVDSSHSMAFHSNPLTHEVCLPKVEVNLSDGSDPIG